jgi:hypothetical protein
MNPIPSVPNWADEVSAWSTLAGAVGAAVAGAGAGAIVAVIFPIKTWHLQKQRPGIKPRRFACKSSNWKAA